MRALTSRRKRNAVDFICSYIHNIQSFYKINQIISLMKILTSLVTYKNSVIKDKMSDALKKFYKKNTLIEGFCQP